MSSDQFLYDAFISYSHAADVQLAPAIQTALHKFAKPWYKLRALNIYRDQTNLSVSPELWPTIQRAISLSSYFLLFASPNAATSKWVKREITWWLENRPANRLFVILTDGEIVWDDNESDFDWEKTNALPNTLSGKFKSEPNFIDFRKFKLEGIYNLRDPIFLENILSIAAPLHGKSKEELGGEDVRQHRITKLITWSASSLIFAISIVAIWQAIIANQQRDLAIEQSSVSLARQLAAQSNLIRTNNFKDLPVAAALAIEALNISATAETDQAAWEAIALLPDLRFETENWLISQIKFSPNGKYLATVGQDSTIRVIEWTSKRTICNFRHTAKIWDIDFSMDGTTLAAAGDDGSIKVINFRVDSLVATFKHQAAVRKVQFSSDGKYLGSASEDNTACIWDIKKKSKQSTIRHTGKVWSLAFSHDNNYAATASRDSTAILWDINKNKLKHRLQHNDILWNVTFSMDDQFVVTTSDDKSAKIWKTSSGELLKRLEHSDRVMAAEFSPDSSALITTSWDKTIKIWSTQNFSQLFTINTAGIILSIVYSPDSRYFVTGGMYTSIWNAATYKELNRLYKEKSVYNLSFSPDGEYIATADSEKARVWKVIDNTRKVMESKDRVQGVGVPIMTKGWAAIMSSNSNHLLTGNDDGLARLWDLEGHKVQTTFNHCSPTGVIAYRSGANLVATAGDSLVKLWDARTGVEYFKYHYGEEVISIDFDASGRLLAIGGGKGLVILQTNSGAPLFIRNSEDPIYFTAFNHTGQSLLTIEASGKLSLYNVREKTRYFSKTYHNLRSATLTPDKSMVCLATEDMIILLPFDTGKPFEKTISTKKGLHVAVSPNKQLAAICQSEDNTVQIVNINTGKEVVTFRQKTDVITTSFDSEGRYLAIGCNDGSIHIRDLKTQAEVSSIFWNADDRIEQIRFSPDNKYVVAASEQYKTAAWLWRASDAINLGCELLEFRLSDADWNLYMNGREYQPICK